MRVTEIVRCATNSVDSIIEHMKQGIQEPTPAMFLGSIYHTLLFEQIDPKAKLQELFIICKDDYRTKEAQALKAEALEKGQLPLLLKDYNKALENVNRVKHTLRGLVGKHPKCEIEVGGFIADFEKVVGHIDCASDSMLVDLKVSTQSKDFNKVIFDSGYQLQLYLYNQLHKQTFNKGYEHLRIIFFNPNSLTFNVKDFTNAEIEAECQALMKKARVNHTLALKGLQEPLVTIGGYMPPQWALKELIEAENLGF